MNQQTTLKPQPKTTNKPFEKIKIPFESFKDKLDENPKIVFSGIFGSGKTTFLKYFFQESDIYESIHLYPVNYSVVSNTDIFELVKNDILLQLLGKVDISDIESDEISFHVKLHAYLFSKYDIGKKIDLFASLFNFIPNYGTAIYKFYDKLKSLKNSYDEYHEENKKVKEETIAKHLEEQTSDKGHIYEEDFLTELIRLLVNKIKERENKKVVLVIDDLDRLDPDHIFRLLNIFSAHIDFIGEENNNKFDFDKVVLVCDYNNIENIFKHKYGTNADFKGYIDKFYTGIYWHDISNLVTEIIGNYLEGIDTGNSDIISDTNRIGINIRFILKNLIDNNLINLRSLVNYRRKFDKYSFMNSRGSSIKIKNTTLNHLNVDIEYVIGFFIDFFENNNNFLNCISKASKIKGFGYKDRYDTNNINKACGILFLVDCLKNNNDPANKVDPVNKPKELKYENYTFLCEIKSIDYNEVVICNEVKVNGININKNEVNLNYFSILHEGVKIYLDHLNRY